MASHTDKFIIHKIINKNVYHWAYNREIKPQNLCGVI